ncbi:Putative 4,5-dihydroxyphthalate dehydrogenase [Planctomycetes bacterium Pan216]|uniref:4,5-dihydroxyphthalate dehydrogenase n=1 Tax=Kolteria novifilia TaxID=2527975 RepID=A0A518B4L4_9BACT|nr:Putative 4,5-dihydroxyphthalate dehydrogenase [Planctomycetes bacterium Pan216]
MSDQSKSTDQTASRRVFLQRSTTAAIGAGLAAGIVPAVHAAGSDTLKVGLIGAGSRGSGAALQTLQADPNVELVAVGDVFQDRIDTSLSALKKSKVADRVKVDKERQFLGFDAYQKVIDSGVDVVLLASPPHFRPKHLEYAIDQGKHVFAEKPVATDPTGVRSVMESCRKAKEKNLSVVSGLCWRYETGMQETIDKIHNGAIGDIVTAESTRFLRDLWSWPREPGQSDMQWQVRNWYYFTWLSGDFIVEQYVHDLDMIAWALNEYPEKCYATGGRIVRTEPKYGNIYDHFAVVYVFPSGARFYAATRQETGTEPLYSNDLFGTKGKCDLMKYRITGENPWRRRAKRTVMHQLEHDEMYKALRAGKPINNGDYMCKSTLMGIMGRESAYTGDTITWDEISNSKLKLGPKEYEWNASLPVEPVRIPGKTKLV